VFCFYYNLLIFSTSFNPCPSHSSNRISNFQMWMNANFSTVATDRIVPTLQGRMFAPAWEDSVRMPLNLDRVKVGHQSCKNYSPLTPRYDKNVAPPVLGYLSNRPQVSMGYRLINHAGFWKNTRRICKSRAAGEWFTNPSSVLPTSQVVYQPINHRKLWSIAFI